MDKDSLLLLCKQIGSVYDKYKSLYSELNDNAERNCVRWEYSKGSKFLRRGYYCPSLVEDIIIGNCSRGTLTDKVSARSKYFKYGYDVCDNMIIVKNDSYGQNEFLIRENNSEIGITFDRVYCIESISECIYDSSDRLISYTYYVFDANGIIWICTREEYSYPENKLIMDRFEMDIAGDKMENYVYKHEKYCFNVEGKNYVLCRSEDCEFITNDDYLNDFKSFISDSMKNI